MCRYVHISDSQAFKDEHALRSGGIPKSKLTLTRKLSTRNLRSARLRNLTSGIHGTRHTRKNPARGLGRFREHARTSIASTGNWRIARQRFWIKYRGSLNLACCIIQFRNTYLDFPTEFPTTFPLDYVPGDAIFKRYALLSEEKSDSGF